MGKMRLLAFIFIFAISIAHTAFAQQYLCDYKIEILVNGTEFQKEDFTWRMRATKVDGKSTNITGTAKIEDLNGKIVKSYKPWSSESISKQKTSNEYSPNLKNGEYKITAEINVECNDTNKVNNIDIKMIKIRDDRQEALTEQDNIINNSPQEIKNVNDNTTKEPIKIGNISQNIPDNEEIKSKPIQDIQLKNTTEKEGSENVIHLMKSDQKSDEVQLTSHAIQNPQIVYESSNEKAKNLIVVSLLILSVLLNAILIWRR